MMPAATKNHHSRVGHAALASRTCSYHFPRVRMTINRAAGRTRHFHGQRQYRPSGVNADPKALAKGHRLSDADIAPSGDRSGANPINFPDGSSISDSVHATNIDTADVDTKEVCGGPFPKLRRSFYRRLFWRAMQRDNIIGSIN